ncbi:MAG: histidine kinase [Ilumatobacteraceae bacterium]
MATDTPASGSPTESGDTRHDGVSWPLVERRLTDNTPPTGRDRRSLGPSALMRTPLGSTLSAAPLWPFRLVALAGAMVRAIPDLQEGRWHIAAITAVAALYTVYAILHPVPYRNEEGVRLRILIEQGVNTATIMLSGAWASPFVLFVVPTGMLAGFACGAAYSAIISVVIVAAVTTQHALEVGAATGIQDGMLWAALLALMAFTSGLAHNTARDADRQQKAALDRVSRLAEANSLLFALQRVAQSLPASLDLDDVLDSTVARLRSMVRYDALTVFLHDPISDRMIPARTIGMTDSIAYATDDLPHGALSAVGSPKTVRLDALPRGGGVAPDARSGVYTALRARGSLIGLLAVEARDESAFGQQQAEVVHGLSEPFGIAIDNARMFLRIRSLPAAEERSRIARDLHDHVGSSLAMIGFEVDRAISATADAPDHQQMLRDLRVQVTGVISEVRDTLHDLRTDVSDTRDLGATAREFIARVQQRAGLDAVCDIDLPDRLPLIVEREVWQIAREAIVNVERHARATKIEVHGHVTDDGVRLIVRDDGIGLDNTRARSDSYGLIGMRERAERLDARLSLRNRPEGGTEMRIDIPEGSLHS